MLMFASFAAALSAVSAAQYTTGFGYGGYSKAFPTTFSTGAIAPLSTAYNTGYSTTGLLGGYSTGFTGLGYNRALGFNGFNRGLGYAGGYTLGSAAVAPLAVQTSHNVQYADVPSGGAINPISVDVDANPIPMNMMFKSASSQLNVQQAHQGAVGSVQESASEDEPHVLKHSVTKPVIQEVREVITPFRRINQEVQPVQEEINTVVARGVNKAVLAAPVAHHGFTNTIAAPVSTTFGHTGFAKTGYLNTGYTGFAAPLTTGYTTGFTAPLSTGYTTGFTAPLSTGYSTGFSGFAKKLAY